MLQIKDRLLTWLKLDDISFSINRYIDTSSRSYELNFTQKY